MSFTNNYSQKTINEVLKNFEFLEDSTSISKRNFELNLKITNSTSQLNAQAITFSENLKTHGYINFYRVMRLREDQVISKLKNLYIYSYVKGLYNGLYYHRISESSNLGLCFAGHDSLMSILKSPNNSGLKDGYMLSVHIDLGNNQYKKALFIRLLAKFKFLRKYNNFSKDSFGTTPFYIPEYEGYLNYLNEDYYSRDHIQRGESVKEDQSKHSNRINNLNYDRGKLNIVKMNQNSSNSILSFNNSPLMNSFYNNDLTKLRFIPVGNGKPVENNPSFFFNKANFIKQNDSGNDKVKIDRIYREFKCSELKHTVCSEVFTNTGIKCQFIQTKSGDKPEVKIPGISKVTEYLESLGDKVGESILQTISDRIDELDLEEFFNELLDMAVKSESQ